MIYGPSMSLFVWHMPCYCLYVFLFNLAKQGRLEQTFKGHTHTKNTWSKQQIHKLSQLSVVLSNNWRERVWKELAISYKCTMLWFHYSTHYTMLYSPRHSISFTEVCIEKCMLFVQQTQTYRLKPLTFCDFILIMFITEIQPQSPRLWCCLTEWESRLLLSR